MCKIRSWMDENRNYALRSLKNLIVFDDVDLEEEQLSDGRDSLGLRIHLLSDIIKQGQLIKADAKTCPKARPPSPEDIYALVYTPGTSGTPKGVQLSHRMMVAVASTFKDKFVLGDSFTEGDCYISY